MTEKSKKQTISIQFMKIVLTSKQKYLKDPAFEIKNCNKDAPETDLEEFQKAKYHLHPKTDT